MKKALSKFLSKLFKRDNKEEVVQMESEEVLYEKSRNDITIGILSIMDRINGVDVQRASEKLKEALERLEIEIYKKSNANNCGMSCKELLERLYMTGYSKEKEQVDKLKIIHKRVRKQRVKRKLAKRIDKIQRIIDSKEYDYK